MKRLALALAGLALLAAPAAADELQLRATASFLAVVDRSADRCDLDAAEVETAKEHAREDAFRTVSAERLQQIVEEEEAKFPDEVVDVLDCSYVREVVAVRQ